MTERCSVCDKAGWSVEHHGFRMHGSCAPLQWRKDAKDRADFNELIRLRSK